MNDQVPDPVDCIDYCSQGCVPDSSAITAWVGETCGCCGGLWGMYGQGVCRGIHIQGQVWADVLDGRHGQ